MASSCDVVVKPAGRARKKKDVKEVKEEIVTKVNDEIAAGEVKAADELPFAEEAFGDEEIIERPKNDFRFSERKGREEKKTRRRKE